MDSFLSFLESPPQRSLGRMGNLDRAIAEAREAATVTARREGFAVGLTQGHQEGLNRGYEEGYANAEREAREKFEAEFTSALTSFKSELQQRVDVLNAAIPAFFADAEEAMADRAIEVVRALLDAELATSRASTLAIVREALKEVTTANHARIRVGTQDASTMNTYKSELLASAATLRDIEFVEDSSITAGCVIECSAGVIDATVSKRLEGWEDAYRAA